MIVTIQIRNVPKSWVEKHAAITDESTRLFSVISLLFSGLEAKEQISALAVLVVKISREQKKTIEYTTGQLYALTQELKN